jgi:thymidylate kinase
MVLPQDIILPRFVVFEGVDGSGKTSLFKRLIKYYKQFINELPLYADSFPGSLPGTLGEWVYRFHHKTSVGGLSPKNVAPPALQLLHVAAHVDTILTRITPVIADNGFILLDRYWWSTYAYSRDHLTVDQTWSLVSFERLLWGNLPQPIIIYLSRQTSLKPGELDPIMHAKLGTYYREVLKAEEDAGLRVHELNNNGSLEDAWETLLNMLQLPYYEVEVIE